MLKCQICGFEDEDFLGDHIKTEHGNVQEYVSKYPKSPIISKELEMKIKSTKKQHPPNLKDCKIKIGAEMFPFHWEVPEEACLPLPDHYKLPEHGELGKDIKAASIALRNGRSLYVWGLPGSGKDAFFHYFSHTTHRPAILKQVKPGTNIESWFFSRSFNEKGTYWEEGEVLKALRDGYKTESGKVIPYLFLITDFDRADREQAENLRLITDSIKGRIDGPAGKTYKVLPGTLIVATANTAGAGDDRGRMVSANPIDASILDRFNVKLQFHWMSWEDECPIIESKFPFLLEKCPGILPKIKTVTEKLRNAIYKDDLYGEFSHRGLSDIMCHAEDIVRNRPDKIPSNLMAMAARVWIDGLPDEENRGKAKAILDPHFRTLDEGDTSHIDKKNKTELPA